MELLNSIFLIIGIFISIFGIVAFFNPNFTRFINAPGGPKMKAMIALIIGIIFLLLGLLVDMPLSVD